MMGTKLEKRREKAARRFLKYWEIDPHRKHLQVRSLSQLERLWLRSFRFSVWDIYVAIILITSVRSKLITEQKRQVLVATDGPFETDNLLKPAGEPNLYALCGGWEIDVDSLVYIDRGPLYSQDGQHTLVKRGTLIRRLVEWIDDNPARKIVTLFSSIVGLLYMLVRILT